MGGIPGETPRGNFRRNIETLSGRNPRQKPRKIMKIPDFGRIFWRNAAKNPESISKKKQTSGKNNPRATSAETSGKISAEILGETLVQFSEIPR